MVGLIFHHISRNVINLVEQNIIDSTHDLTPKQICAWFDFQHISRKVTDSEEF